VVATPVGAVSDAIVQGETGLLVPVGDAPALAQALRRLVTDPLLRRHLGLRARARYEEMFELSAFNAKLAGIFDHLTAPAAAAGEAADGPPQSNATDAA